MNRIKELRAEKQMTQQELAGLMGVVRTTLSNYENEINQLDPQTIRRLCEVFDCTADYLLGLSSARTPELTDADADLVAAYHAAPAEIQNIIDTALEPYRKKKITAAG